jgi:predicted AlkP superfamily pyrophosphatase or phosphodiesterase
MKITRKGRNCALAIFICLVALALASYAAPRDSNVDSSLSAPPSSIRAKRALVISIDGLDARYLRKRDEYGLKIPTLRRLMEDGVWARGVTSVYPSLTYPAHTTIVTGVMPRRHGIFGNDLFEPPPAPQTMRGHWFARDIRVETLWDAAARARLTTGLVSWPVAAGAGDWNVPEFWSDSQQRTLAMMSLNARPRGFVEEVAKADPQLFRYVTKDEHDDMRTRFAEYIIERKKPQLMLVHLFDFDHFQHKAGPFTPEALAILEKSDAYVGRMLAAAERAGTLRETAVFIVTDHGFKPISKLIHAGVILERAGLLTLRKETDEQGNVRALITDWRAMPYRTAGSCAIILRDPKDADTLKRALAAFREFEGAEHGGAREKGSGILRIINSEHLNKLGANSRAAFVLEGSDGYAFGGNLTGEPLTPSKDRGQHGYLPHGSDYLASFIASGAGVARRGDVGLAHMLDIAPTVARTLGLKLRAAEGHAIRTEGGK